MGNSGSKTKNFTSDDQGSRIGTLIPPLFGTGCDVWSPPPTRSSSIFNPHWKRRNEFSFTNSFLNENSSCLSSIISKLLMNPLVVCSPGMALLSEEHLRVGIWHSASTPELDGKLLTRWSGNHRFHNASEDTSIGIRVTKLFPRLTKHQNDLEALAGVDVNLNVPAENVNEGAASGRIHAFYHLGLVRNLGSVVLSATVENINKDTNITGKTALRQDLGIHYNNRLIYSTSKALLISLGITSQLTFGSELSLRNGSAYIVCNSLPDGWLASVQAEIPISRDKTFKELRESTSTWPNLRSYLFSFDLNRLNNFFSTSTQSLTQLDSPIVLSFHNVHANEGEMIGSSCNANVPAITVSQYIPMERIIFNPLEDRGPEIRNTLSWAFQIRQPSVNDESPNSAAIGSANERPKRNVLRAAVAWQVNRNLCTKLHFDTRDGLILGIIIKRWAHPRLTTSVLFSEEGKSRRFGLKGVCVQAETGPLADGDDIYDANEFLYRVDAGMFRNAGDFSHGTKYQAPTVIEYHRNK